MKKILFLLAIAFSASVMAQTTLPKTVEASQPRALLASVLLDSEIAKITAANNWGQSSPASKYWVVYSDRDRNTTYSSPTGGTKFDELKFNEKVRIAKISGKFALVYTEPKQNVTYPSISEVAKCRGWVPMDQLLLWNTCPADEKGIYHKALIVVNLDDVRGKADIGKIYRNPSDRQNPGRLVSDMNFYFVMKTDANGLVLLARQYKMEGATDQVLYGWVSSTSFVPWNQRSCLEPNWEPDVVEYMKGKNIDAEVYSDRSLASSSAHSHYTYGRKNGDDNPLYCYRMPRAALRFPILNNDTDNDQIYKCTTFGNGGSLGDAMLYESRLREMENKATTEMQNLNLIIAIDGTSSMEKYFPSVKDAIKRGYQTFRDNYKVRVGIVIYRDYADGDCLYEVLPLTTPTDARIDAFLDNGGHCGIGSNPGDHTHEEALYKGLEIATDPSRMGFNNKSSNLLLVVGDCGNDLNDTKCMSKEQLLKRLEDNHIQLMSFQVRRNNVEPWLLFGEQMSDMIKGNVDNQYRQLGDVTAKFKQNADGYDLKTDLAHQFFVGTLRFASIGVDMDPAKLSSLIQQNLQLFSTTVQTGIDVIVNNPFAANTHSDNLEAKIDSAFIISRLGREYYNYVKESNTMVAFNGYVKKDDGNGHAYWKPVIYISSDEFTSLLNRLEPVNRAARTGNDDRKPYVDALKALIRSMIPDITEEEMGQKSTQEIMALISGLNASTKSLGGYTLLQIQDPRSVGHDEFLTLVNDFARKYRNLSNIKKSGYTYSLEVNNTRYYWIPVDDLP